MISFLGRMSGQVSFVMTIIYPSHNEFPVWHDPIFENRGLNPTPLDPHVKPGRTQAALNSDITPRAQVNCRWHRDDWDTARFRPILLTALAAMIGGYDH